MKIIHLASGDLWAGAEVQLFHLTKRLSQFENVKLLVVLLNHGQLEDSLKNNGVEVHVLDESLLPGFSLLKQFYRIAKEFLPDIIHTHRIKENVIGGVTARLIGKKSVRTEHGAPEIFSGRFDFRRFLINSLDKFSAMVLQQKVVAVSGDLKEKLAKRIPETKIVVIENCVDVEYVERRSNELTDYHLESERFKVAFIGRFVPVKRVDLFYAIAKYMSESNPAKEIHFYMIGDGPLKEGLESKVVKDGLQSKMHFYGFIDNIAPILKQMDLLLITSDHEGLPMTLLEAMTLGVPVLSRDLPSVRYVLCEGKCGYFVEDDNLLDYASIIDSICSSKTESEEIAKLAYAQIQHKYNIDINVNQYLSLYENVLAPDKNNLSD